jgi:hypothetical protein
LVNGQDQIVLLFISGDPSSISSFQIIPTEILPLGLIKTSNARIDKEFDEIEKIQKISKKRDEFRIEHKFATRKDELWGVLSAYKPEIVHFTGHGNFVDGFKFEDETGYNDVLSIIARYKSNIKLVVYNTCNSINLARDTVKIVPFSIGTVKKINDTPSIEFSKRFYEFIFNDDSIRNAFDHGIAFYNELCGKANSSELDYVLYHASKDANVDSNFSELIGNRVQMIKGSRNPVQERLRSKWHQQNPDVDLGNDEIDVMIEFEQICGEKIPRLGQIPAGANNLFGYTVRGGNVKELSLKGQGWYEGKIIPIKKDRFSIECRSISILPESIKNLVGLRVLYVSMNQLTSLPEGIGKLEKLERLDLSDNNLKNLPSTIGDLRALTFLDLSNNNLKALPETIGSNGGTSSLILKGL